MRKINFHHGGAKVCGGGLVGLALLASQVHGQVYDPDWTKDFRIGVLIGFNIKANFKMSGKFDVTPNPAGTYDDGYVRVDATGNAGHLTSNWGYDSALQFDSANTLTMHNLTGFTTSGTASSQNAPYVGFDMAYGGILWRGEDRLRIGWELGFGLLPIKITDNQTLIASHITQDVYKFDTGTISLPDAGYQGGSSGIGPLISDTYVKSPDENLPGTGTISGTRTLDVNLYAIKLGPSFFWDLTPRIGVALSAGPALGIVSGSLKYNETLDIPGAAPATNKGQVNATELTYGGYVGAMFTYHTVQNGDFYIGAQYMPMANVTLSGNNLPGNNRSATLDLRGQVYISTGVNWPF